jgi:hypothetical protein
MRQSTARTTQPCMDRERADQAWLTPDRVSFEVDPYVPIAAARRENLDRIVAQVRARGREPRVCLYAIFFEGQVPRASLDSAAEYAQRQSWQVLSGQTHMDSDDLVVPGERPGWGLVRQQVRAGFADGVVVVTASVISHEADEYRSELDWFEEHFGFVALVVPELRAGRA